MHSSHRPGIHPRREALRLAAACVLAALLAASAQVAPAAAGTARETRPARPAALLTSFERAVVAQINRARRNAGLRRLRVAPGLVAAARSHARSMARSGYFSHTSRDGLSPSARIRRYYPGRVTGEALLWRAPSLTAHQALQMWLASPPHRALLLSSRFREIGLGARRTSGSRGAFSGPATILVADFGAR